MTKFPYPENPALTDAPLIESIKRRWSPLAFSSEPIEEKKIQAILEAARWTQSSRNEQPWRIVYATKDNPEEFDRLASLLNDNDYAKEAYLLMLICSVPTHEYKDKPNRTHQHDTGAATHAMFLQAVGSDLIAHVIGGFDKEAPYDVLGIPKEMELMTMMAVGYPGDESKIDKEVLEKRYAQHQDRKPLDGIAFKGKWKA